MTEMTLHICNNYVVIMWVDTMESITQVYLQQIGLKITNNYKNKQTVICILLSVEKLYTINKNSK